MATLDGLDDYTDIDQINYQLQNFDASYILYGIVSKARLPPDIVYNNDFKNLINNIALNKYVSGVSATVSTPTITGSVNISLLFYGNAPSYNYTMNIYGDRSYSTSGVSNGNSAYYSQTFPTGTYYIKVIATTSGVGEGSRYETPNSIGTIIVGVVDNIASPYVNLIGNYNISTNSLVYISGLPWYSTNTVVNFPPGTLRIANVKNTIDPTTIGKVLRIASTNYALNKTHSDVFGSTSLTLVMTNTNNISISLQGGAVQSQNVSAQAFNITYPSGGNWTNLVSGIYYVPYWYSTPTLPIDYSQIQVGSHSYNYQQGYYNPFDNTFYENPASINRGTNAPYTSITSYGNSVRVSLNSTLGLTSFVVNVEAGGVSALNVSWGGGTTYDAFTTVVNGGCGNATYVSGSTRFPVRCPITRTSAETIVITFVFSSWIKSISFTNS